MNMGKVWQLQEAKNKFSQVVNDALAKGPQVITRRGEEVVVILSKSEFSHLKGTQISLVEFFQNSPLAGLELDLTRDSTLPRDLEL
jgi:prevent-host-death family protein